MNIYLYQTKDKYGFNEFSVHIFGHDAADIDVMNEIEKHWQGLFPNDGIKHLFEFNNTKITNDGNKVWSIHVNTYSGLVEVLWRFGISEIKPDFMWDDYS